jgi:uncharacterized protein YktA (UPF0223 family)
LLVNIDNKNAAGIIKKVLEEFKSVKAAKVFGKQEKGKLLEALEEEEDIIDYKAFKKAKVKTVALDDVVAQWKKIKR